MSESEFKFNMGDDKEYQVKIRYDNKFDINKIVNQLPRLYHQFFRKSI